MEMQKRLHENISALADGELASSELELALAALDTPEGRAAWDAYHQIGHALRADSAGFELSAGFNLRLAARLLAEAPVRAIPRKAAPSHSGAAGASDLGDGAAASAAGGNATASATILP